MRVTGIKPIVRLGQHQDVSSHLIDPGPDTPTPVPTVPPPSLVTPKDGAPFNGESAIIKLTWSSTHFLLPDQYYELLLRWTQDGTPASQPVYVQETFWFVDRALYLRADLDTEREYLWSVGIVQRQLGADEDATYVPLGPPSEERAFTWQ